MQNDDGGNTVIEYSSIIPDGELFSDADKQKLSFKITKHMANRPITVCASTCLFILLITIITFTAIPVFSVDSEYDWIIASAQASKNSDARSAAVDQVDSIDADLVGERRQLGQSFSYLYKSNGGDVFTAKNLLSMCETETLLVKDAKFEDFCVLDDMGNCDLSQALSIPLYFYEFPTLSNWSCTLLNETDVAAKKNRIYSVMNTPAGIDAWGTFLDVGAVDRGYSVMGASYWFLGTPLAGYNSTTDREEEQDDKYKEFVGSTGSQVGGVEGSLFTYFKIESNADSALAYYPTPYLSEADAGKLEVLWSNSALYVIEEQRIINTDLQFTIFSLLFVWLWLRVHTGSTFVSSMGMYMIFTSLPFSIFIYKVIYQVPYFSTLHVLVIFIILGVGADDILVLVDSWEKTRLVYPAPITNGKNRDVVHRRLYECYTHTVATVFNTSLTTAMAFIATGLSPLMPIATFGWFAATCICVNYLFVITMMPPVVVLAESYFYHWIPCSEPTSGEMGDDEGAQSLPSEDQQTAKELEKADITSREQNTDSITLENDNTKVIDENKENPRTGIDNEYELAAAAAPYVVEEDLTLTKSCTPRIDKYLKVLETTVEMPPILVPILGIKPVFIVAWVLVFSLAAFGIIGVVYGVSLQPPTEPEEWFPTQHMFTRYDKANSELGGGKDEDFEGISINLGIAKIVRGSKFNKFKPLYRGEVVYDDGFHLAAPACQKAIVQMCSAIPDYTVGDVKLARFNTTECFMTAYRNWAMDEYNEDTYLMNETMFYSGLQEFRNTQTMQYDYASYENLIGFVDGDLKFVSVPFVSTMVPWAAMDDKAAYNNAMKRMTRDVQAFPECSANECDCSSLMFTSDFAFTWLPSEEGLVDGFYQGLYIAFPVSFVVLLYATGNLIISIYAMTAVFLIVFSVLGFLAYGMNASLGIAESIAGIIIIGFSVDYTVHLGHMYNHAEHDGIHDRKSKVEYASRKIVSTIIGGAITTAGAGTFMFACQLTFFSKMATLIVATIIMSVLYSLFFLQSVLLCFGPENDQGNVLVMWNQFRTYISLSSTATSTASARTVKVISSKDDMDVVSVVEDDVLHV